MFLSLRCSAPFFSSSAQARSRWTRHGSQIAWNLHAALEFNELPLLQRENGLFWPLIWLLSQIFGIGSQKQAKNGQKGQKLAVNAANECTFEIDLLLGLVV